MALLYAGYLIHAFQEPEEGRSHGAGHAARWSVRLALIVLAASAIATGVLSELLVGAIEPTIEETGIGTVFVGLVIVPIIGNVAEHFAAVKSPGAATSTSRPASRSTPRCRWRSRSARSPSAPA